MADQDQVTTLKIAHLRPAWRAVDVWEIEINTAGNNLRPPARIHTPDLTQRQVHTPLSHDPCSLFHLMPLVSGVANHNAINFATDPPRRQMPFTHVGSIVYDQH